MIKKNTLKLAERVANYSNVRRAKVSAIAMTPSGQIISYAHNRRIESHPKKWTEHAEMVLLSKMNKMKIFDRIGKITIVVMRFSSKGVDMAKPCARCSEELRKYPISIFYSSRNGQIIKLGEHK